MNRRNESYVPLLCNYPESEKINKVSEGAEAMFCRLLAKCDDEGNYYGSPKRLLCKLYALRYENGSIDEKTVLRYRDELVTATLLTRYASGNVGYLHINDCKKSLRNDVALKVYFPEFTQTLAVTEDNERVTEPGRTRDEPVTPNQTNPIQKNPIQDKAIFDIFRKLYPGKKRGLDPEFENFKKKYKNWRDILPLLKPAAENQIALRAKIKDGEWQPSWKNLQTWINNQCWTEEAEQNSDGRDCVDCHAPYAEGHKYQIIEDVKVWRCPTCRGAG